jgi:hypothetical protein
VRARGEEAFFCRYSHVLCGRAMTVTVIFISGSALVEIEEP